MGIAKFKIWFLAFDYSSEKMKEYDWKQGFEEKHEKTVLVTGITGQLGHDVVLELLRRRYNVIGTGRQEECTISEVLGVELGAITDIKVENLEDVNDSSGTGEIR